MEFDIKAMGARIRAERKRSGLTIERFSERLDTSFSFIGLLERGECGLKLETLVRLSQTLQVTTDYLLTGTDTPTENPQLKPLNINAALLPAEDVELLTIIAANLADRALGKMKQ
jgi:transcriptional regulator with XRE-family HTH domain